MEIIEYNNHYLSELGRVYSHVFSSSPWNEEWSEKEAIERLAHIASMNDGIGFIATIDGKAIGALLGFIYPYQGNKTCEIRELFVSACHTGEGIGKQLLNRLNARCRQNGISKISLRTGKESDAFYFYKNCGFTTNEKVIMLSKDVG